MFLRFLRKPERKSYRGVLLGVLLLGQGLAFAHAVGAAEAQDFVGTWKYKQSCGYQHSVTLDLSRAGNAVTGDWTDGTRLDGSDGSLKGRFRDGKLYVRYCGGDEHAGYPVCPAYEAEESGYLVRRGNDLVWYRKSGGNFEQYVVLHRDMKGKQLQLDTDCKGEED